VVIPFSAAQTIAATGTSPDVVVTFGGGISKGNFTSTGDSGGTHGKFSSIIAHETNVSPSNDELVSAPPVPVP
jgi:hypothetical protein